MLEGFCIIGVIVFCSHHFKLRVKILRGKLQGGSKVASISTMKCDSV